MTSNIVLPPLKTWATERLTALITASTQADFDRAFDSFVSKDVKVTFNGAPLTRDQYKKQLQGERILERSATINVLNAIQAAQLNTQASETSGLVGMFYDATYVEKILILGAPAEHSNQSSLNIHVETDKSIPLPPAGIHGDVERRRVFSLNQVSVDQRGEINKGN
ncbi:hypothetical protein EW145_g4853 [Phellinidium pouzarii]|uniref:NTF2 domain-containing protein n=1 Tax=Phellinidium pouzarii TaxID=167371 RepID=A0A4V3XCD0_9AGAM|nr:hypothetical protein EW145_g4853 [Phellinidium pouzarii]